MTNTEYIKKEFQKLSLIEMNAARLVFVLCVKGIYGKKIPDEWILIDLEMMHTEILSMKN